MITEIVLRPDKLYAPSTHDRHWRLARGARRNDGRRGRSLALFDALGITKRRNEVGLLLSADGHAALARRADALGVSIAALAAFLIESALREDRCRAGHDLTADNVVKERDGTRRCRACRRAYDQARNARATP